MFIIFAMICLHLLAILASLSVAVASPVLVRNVRVCSNLLDVKQVTMANQNELIVRCSSSVDSSEPILAYNLATNTSYAVPKNATELVSTFYYEASSLSILFGTFNSTLYQYDTSAHKITWNLKSSQPSVVVGNIFATSTSKMIVWVGNDGKVCAANPLSNKTSCTLAHAFNATIVYAHTSLDQIFTCGGDRMCRLWRFDQSNGSISLLKSFSLSRISKVTVAAVSSRRAVVGGPEGYESFAVFEPVDKVGYLHGGPVVCVYVAQEWGHMLTLSPNGVLSVTQLFSGAVVTQHQLGEKIDSCYFLNLNTLATGHEKGEVEIWKY